MVDEMSEKKKIRRLKIISFFEKVLTSVNDSFIQIGKNESVEKTEKSKKKKNKYF
jgi:hypothetical protein